MTTLQIKNLSATHRKDLRPLIQGLSLTLRPGERCAIIGEEGNGKSTLLKLIADPAAAEDYVEYSGQILLEGAIGYLKQELSPAEQELSVLDFFQSQPSFWDRSPGEIALAARDLGLPADVVYEERPLGSFSGGESLRLQLLRLRLLEPELILLDEPSNGLDLPGLRWLERFILGCQQPVLYVSHDETLLERTANCVLHLELLRRKTLPRATFVRWSYGDYVSRRLRALAHQEQVAREEQAAFAAQQQKLREIKGKVEQDLRSISRGDPHGGRLLKKKMHAVTSMEKRYQREEEQLTQLPDVEEAIALHFPPVELPRGKRVLDFRERRLESPDGRLLAENLSLSLMGGEKLALVGANGLGKSTLLRQLAAELSQRRDIRCAYMPQDYGELLPWEQSPVDFLRREGSRQEESALRSLLGSVRYTPQEMDHPIADLSGGQKAKLLFLHLIRSGANVLLLDEPTRNFSPLSNPVIRQILRDYEGSILAVSHDRKFIAQVADRVLLLTPQGLLPQEKEEVLR